MSSPRSNNRAPYLVGRDAVGEAARAETVEDFGPNWCQELLNDPSYARVALSTRKLGAVPASSYNTLMGKTLFTDHTLRAVVFLYKPSRVRSDQASASQPFTAVHMGMGGELLALISLGRDMCSHSDTLHGGINTLLVDEIGGALAMQECAEPLMAVNFNVNLRRSVKTPGIVLGRAWMDRSPQGRKYWVKIRLEQDGQICVESENLYLKMLPRGKL